MFDPYAWYANRYVVQPILAALAHLQAQLNVIQAQNTELQTTMSTADDKVTKLVSDVDAVLQAFADLKAQLLNEVGLSPDSLAALDAADAKIQAVLNPPATPPTP